ncbi:MAG: transcription-repair coupling factor [Verrucomicrobiota bacterium]|nr:transcription-repair coupling factor [Verrucomicrobiota bacterium]
MNLSKKKSQHFFKLHEFGRKSANSNILLETDDFVSLVLALNISADLKQMLVVLPDLQIAERVKRELENWIVFLKKEISLFLFPEIIHHRNALLPENEGIRCHTLCSASKRTPGIYITTIAATREPLISHKKVSDQTFDISVGDDKLPPEKLVMRLLECDYDNEFETHMSGEYARRGGIVDIFSPQYQFPARIEFFGDTVDTIRFFDPETQRSIKKTDKVKIIPRSVRNMSVDKKNSLSFINYFTKNSDIVFAYPEKINAQIKRFFDDSEAIRFRKILKKCDFRYIKLQEEAIDIFENRKKEELLPVFPIEPAIKINMEEIEDIHSHIQWKELIAKLRIWKKNNYTIYAFFRKENEAGRLKEILTSYKAKKTVDQYVEQELPMGFVLPEPGEVLLTEREVYGIEHKENLSRKKKSSKSSNKLEYVISDILDLEEDDYAVHAAYGIGIYKGLVLEKFDGEIRENMLMQYADDVKVYVPLSQAHLVSKYLGHSKKKIKLSRVGAKSWGKARESAESAIQNFASELLRIQAAREAGSGNASSKDDDWQNTFEALFPYSETDDQLDAIEAVKNDMEEKKSMDRLICGDAGYGKTEVALRAAFKAVSSGYQVAFVAPTTILVQQHFMTLCERMSPFPIQINMLSRFRTKQQQNETLKSLSEGIVDIVVGTHRLLQKDVNFKNLGLVIIDEEQRFGVKHKEFLKRLRMSVDILTMTATPIPRTLYLSMSGLRNLSTITTPPQKRTPIKTIVARYDKEIISEAINNELERGGQVFYVHNRVKTIEKVCLNLQQLAPEASFVAAHGQMDEHELEEIMTEFIKGRTDVLVCTTIIENGIDIANANTIIIDRADRFGLSGLYQLRGRVGRSYRQAYAYFLLPPHQMLGANAEMRIDAIKRYTEVGAGFKLAIRDLEIRGAGNILGSEQSGHIEAIGFELYCQLLKETVKRLKENKKSIKPKCYMQLDFVHDAINTSSETLSIGIPDKYVPDNKARIGLFRRMATLSELKELNNFKDELRDRFGPLPECTKNFLNYIHLRITANAKNLTSVTSNKDKILLETQAGLFKKDENIPRFKETNPAKKLQEILYYISDI